MRKRSKSTFGNCGPVEAVYKNGEVTMRLSKCAKRKKKPGAGSKAKSRAVPSASMPSRSHPSDQPSFPSGEWDMKTKGVGRVYNVRRKPAKGKCYCATAIDRAGFIIAFKCNSTSKPKLLQDLKITAPNAHKIRIKKCHTPYGVAS